MAAAAEQRVLRQLAIEVAGGALLLFPGDGAARVAQLAAQVRAGQIAGFKHENQDSPGVPLSG